MFVGYIVLLLAVQDLNVDKTAYGGQTHEDSDGN